MYVPSAPHGYPPCGSWCHQTFQRQRSSPDASSVFVLFSNKLGRCVHASRCGSYGKFTSVLIRMLSRFFLRGHIVGQESDPGWSCVRHGAYISSRSKVVQTPSRLARDSPNCRRTIHVPHATCSPRVRGEALLEFDVVYNLISTAVPHTTLPWGER
ncbi:hypothetical protein BV22DRAFT_862099 [Leucogyrophana mollusca]|uniref:Uncharacterized protein n=1 Tax=Leucogyrophana mollusca TaxID=85980 RepID=A0ACB8B146_9AGAM|nr:hypothetical protein BV22DRAFT_862099 [Leucogyrophana mollusca]